MISGARGLFRTEDASPALRRLPGVVQDSGSPAFRQTTQTGVRLVLQWRTLLNSIVSVRYEKPSLPEGTKMGFECTSFMRLTAHFSAWPRDRLLGTCTRAAVHTS